MKMNYKKFIGQEVKDLSVQLAPYKRPVNIVVRKETNFQELQQEKLKRNVVKKKQWCIID